MGTGRSLGVSKGTVGVDAAVVPAAVAADEAESEDDSGGETADTDGGEDTALATVTAMATAATMVAIVQKADDDRPVTAGSVGDTTAATWRRVSSA